MRTRLISGLGALCALFVGVTPPAFATTGAVAVRVADNAQEWSSRECVHFGQGLTLNVVAARVINDSDWLRHDRTAVFTYEIGFSGRTNVGTSGATNDQVTLIRTDTHQIGEYLPGSNALAVSVPLLTRFEPAQSTTERHDRFETVRVRLVVTSGSELGDGARTIVNVLNAIGSVPLPPNPFSAGFATVSDVYTKVAKPALDRAVGSERGIEGTIGFTIREPSESCDASHGAFGAQAIIFRDARVPHKAAERANFISSLDDLDQRYCFRRSQSGTSLQYAPQVNSQCPSAPATYHDVSNSYVLFVATPSIVDQPHVTPSPAALVSAPTTNVDPAQVAAAAEVHDPGFVARLTNLRALLAGIERTDGAPPVLSEQQQAQIAALSQGGVGEALYGSSLCERYGVALQNCLSSAATVAAAIAP